jgi:REP element-mobilizing transposase RayT
MVSIALCLQAGVFMATNPTPRASALSFRGSVILCYMKENPTVIRISIILINLLNIMFVFNIEFCYMEKFNGKYRIPSSRWQNWDYGSIAAYYVTICTCYHECYFGKIVLCPEKTMQYSELGSIAFQYWTEIPVHFPFVDLDTFVIMPNHVHGIIIINKHDHEIPVETQNLASLQSPNNIRENKTQNLASLQSPNIIRENETQNLASLQSPNNIPENETQNLASLHAFPKKNPNRFGPQSKNLASIIRGYKTGVKKYATMHKIDFSWQSRFHDHVIRNQNEYTAISNYINQNITNWESDDFYQ